MEGGNPNGESWLDELHSRGPDNVGHLPTWSGYSEALDRLLTAVETKALVTKWHEAILGQGDPEAIDAVVAPEFVGQALSGSVVIHGPAGVKAFVSWYHTAFTDVRMTIDDLSAEGETAVARTTHQGTYQGGWPGIRAQGQKVTLRITTIYRVATRQIREACAEFSDLHLLGQLGALPQDIPVPRSPLAQDSGESGQ